MSKSFNRPFTPLPQTQQYQENTYSTPDASEYSEQAQVQLPCPSQFDEQSYESGAQDAYYAKPELAPSKKASPFEIPATPFFDIPATPVPEISATPTMPTIPVTPPSTFAIAPFPAIPNTPAITIPATPVPTEEPGIVAPQQRRDVERYVQWLQRNNSLPLSQAKLQAYQTESLEIKKVGKSEVRTFAPFQERTSAFRVMTADQFTICAAIVICWLVGLFFLHLAMFTFTLGAVTLLYISGFIISSLLATRSLSDTSGEKIDEGIIHTLDQVGVEWPTYTILCPLYKESVIVPQFVRAIQALDYPEDKLQVLFLTEENDDETRAALYNMYLPASFTILTVPKGSPQTKPRACNFGLLQAKGQFVVIFDGEDKPEPYQLKKAVLTFANHGPEVACVQAKLNYYNANQNLLTRWFTAEYSTWFDIILPGLQRIGFSLPLGGTSNHFRTEVLHALGGWDAFNVTEDCDLGLRISQYNLKTAVLDSTTYEEATSRYKVWLFQRSRWIKGYLQTYLVHMRRPFQMLRKGQFRTFFSLQIIVGAWTVVLLLNPFVWALTLLYMLFRPVQLYSVLFPGPVLYMGAFCLIFGNFFYIYIHIIGCLRRQEYALIKWVLLIPLYWIMMSMAAYIAFYQLIVKPHYWEKTQHGNHLAPAAKTRVLSASPQLAFEERAVLASMPIIPTVALTVGGMLNHAVTAPPTLESTTQRVTALRGILTTQLGQRRVHWQIHLPHIRDRWLIVTLILALITSISSTYYVFTHHLTLAYGDAVSHMEIARRVFDNVTPGLAQLGGIWLPLPHLLMIPFVWNDYLWMTGLAGSIVGMSCYLITAIYLFLSARRLTHNSFMSFAGTLVYILNPNVLYLQATPLTEPVCQATYTMTCYFLLAWVQEEKRKYLVLTAICTLVATLARYDGWVLVVVCPIAILITGLLKRFSIRKIEGYLFAFITLSSIGIVLWLIWGLIIFGDPLYFQRSSTSSQAQTGTKFEFSKFNLPIDFRLYTTVSVETLGIALSLLAFVAIMLYFFRRWRSWDTIAALAFLAPFFFYIVALFVGQVGLFDSKAIFYPLGIIPIDESTHLFNARFGSEMVAPAAIFIATLFPSRMQSKISYKTFKDWALFLAKGVLISFIVMQSVWLALHGVITVMVGEYPPFCVNSYSINIFLAEHYNGGSILQTDYPFHLSEAEAGIHFSHIIYEGSNGIWDQALHHPDAFVNWVIFSPKDRVATALAEYDPEFTRQFTLVATAPYGLQLYHRNGLPPLPTFPLSSYLLSEQQFCHANTYLNSREQTWTQPQLYNRNGDLAVSLYSPYLLSEQHLHSMSNYQSAKGY
ncbi:MAG: hypothetical protein NVS4B12_22940 [Ktedonobacteraceae bacterium]